MNGKDTIVIEDKKFQILKCERKEIFQPEAYGISPIWYDSCFDFVCDYLIEDFQLFLKSFIISSDHGFPVINGVNPEPVFNEEELETVQYMDIMEPMSFTGAIVVGNSFIKNYGKTEEVPCFSFKEVQELIFQDGKLVTTIDHSKAMLRIRKNLDLGLRNMDKHRDESCINRFLKSSFAGDYAHLNSVKNGRKESIFKTCLKKIKKKN